MESQGIKVITIHPLGNMNMCVKLHSNPSGNSRDNAIKNKNVNLAVVLGEKSGDHPWNTHWEQ